MTHNQKKIFRVFCWVALLFLSLAGIVHCRNTEIQKPTVEYILSDPVTKIFIYKYQSIDPIAYDLDTNFLEFHYRTSEHNHKQFFKDLEKQISGHKWDLFASKSLNHKIYKTLYSLNDNYSFDLYSEVIFNKNGHVVVKQYQN